MTLEEFCGGHVVPGSTKVNGCPMVTRGQFVVIKNTDVRIPVPQSQITYIVDVGSLILDPMIPSWGNNSSEVTVYEPRVTMPVMSRPHLKRQLERHSNAERRLKSATDIIAECVENRIEQWNQESPPKLQEP